MRTEGEESKPTPSAIDDDKIETEDVEDLDTGENAEIEDEDNNTDDEDEKSDKSNEDKTDEEEEFSISIGTPEPEDDDDDDDPDADKGQSSKFRELRRRLKEAKRENKQLKQQRESKSAEEQLPALGEKPTLEDPDIDFDQEKFEEKLLNWHETKRQHDAKREATKKRHEAMQTKHQGRMQQYADRKSEILKDVPDYEDAEELFIETFDETMQGVLVTATNDPAVLVLALSKHPKKLETLKAIDDPIEFAATVAKMEERLTVTGSKSKKPEPERRLKPGNGKSSGVSDTQLEALEREADRTGDRTKVQAYKRRQKLEAQKRK